MGSDISTPLMVFWNWINFRSSNSSYQAKKLLLPFIIFSKTKKKLRFKIKRKTPFPIKLPITVRWVIKTKTMKFNLNLLIWPSRKVQIRKLIKNPWLTWDSLIGNLLKKHKNSKIWVISVQQQWCRVKRCISQSPMRKKWLKLQMIDSIIF